MHEQLWEQLEGLDQHDTAARAMCRQVGDPPRYVITMLNADYTVNVQNRTVQKADGDEASFIEQLCILAYLINAKDLPQAGELAKGESFPGGQFFFRGGHAMPTEKLAQALGSAPEKLIEGSKPLGGREGIFGNASVEIRVLPRIPITFVVWAEDEEFPASASILFDKTACEHFQLDALLAAVNVTLNTILENAKAG